MNMRSLELSLSQYGTDKISGRYLEKYDPMLQPWVDKKITLLELGIYKGESLLLWRDYFQRGTIVGIDIKLPAKFQPTDRIHLYKGSQTNRSFLSSVANSVAPEGVDIIIDDASHFGAYSKIAFWHLFNNHLKPGGLYVIEDWGTGYWNDWPDGKSMNIDLYNKSKLRLNHFILMIINKMGLKIPFRSHNYGMVGFVKQLIDEQGAHDATRKTFKSKPKRASKFECVTIYPSIVFVKKALD